MLRRRGVPLAGTPTVPVTGGRVPAVLLHGSGAGDRDYFDLFPPIRDHFAEGGIAVLCCDKPGVGGSGGDWRHQTL